MPIYRRTRRPRRTMRRRRLVRRVRRSIRRPIRSRNTKLFNFKRTALLTTITQDETTQAMGALTFKISDLFDYGEFKPLFDSYRMKAVRIVFQPNFTNSNITSAVAGIGLGSLHTAIDHQDSVTPTGELQLMQYDKYRRSRHDRIHKRYFKVNTLDQGYTYSEDVLTPYNQDQKWRAWYPTALLGETNEPVYLGLKYVSDLITANTSIDFKVYVTYYFQMKSVI